MNGLCRCLCLFLSACFMSFVAAVAHASIPGASGPAVMSGPLPFSLQWPAIGTEVGSPVYNARVAMASQYGTGAVTVAEDISFRSGVGPSARVLAGTATRVLTADAVRAVAGRVVPYIGVAMTAYELYKMIRCNHDGGGSIMCDEGVPPGTQDVVCWTSGSSDACFGAGAEAAEAFCKSQFPLGCSVGGGSITGTAPHRVFQGTCVMKVDPALWGTSQVTGACSASESGTTQKKACEEAVDALDPAWNHMAGGAPGPDGKCPTGRYTSATPAQVADKVKPALDQHPEFGPKVVSDSLPYVDIDPYAGPRSIDGPSTNPGEPEVTTTSNPDGTTTTTTKTPTQNITYTPGTSPSNPPTATYTTSTVTNTCTGVGSCSTTTTTGQKAEPSDQCKANPNSLGCAEMGSPPSDEVPSSNKQVDFASETVNLPSGCPPPFSIALPGGATHGAFALGFSYQPMCDVAPIVKAGLLACTALAAALMVLNTVTKS